MQQGAAPAECDQLADSISKWLDDGPAPSAPEAFSAPAPGQPSPTQVWVGASAVCRVGFAGIRAGARGPPPPPGDAARFSTKSFSRSSTK